MKLVVESASNPVVSIDLCAEGLSVKDVVVENIGELRLLKLAEAFASRIPRAVTSTFGSFRVIAQ